jgi:DNA polymerase III sliding clamp (beta) subunit (PCNA family)
MTITPTHSLTTTRTNTATLVAAVKDALHAVPKKVFAPVLTMLRIHANFEHIVVTGFDYDFSVTRTVSGVGDLPAVLVPGVPLRDALTRLDQKQDVSITVDGDKVTITQGTRSVTLKATIPVEEFPTVPTVHGPVFETTGTVLSTFSSSLSPFASKDDMLPALTTVRSPAWCRSSRRWSRTCRRSPASCRPVWGSRSTTTTSCGPSRSPATRRR